MVMFFKMMSESVTKRSNAPNDVVKDVSVRELNFDEKDLEIIVNFQRSIREKLARRKLQKESDWLRKKWYEKVSELMKYEAILENIEEYNKLIGIIIKRAKKITNDLETPLFIQHKRLKRLLKVFGKFRKIIIKSKSDGNDEFEKKLDKRMCKKFVQMEEKVQSWMITICTRILMVYVNIEDAHVLYYFLSSEKSKKCGGGLNCSCKRSICSLIKRQLSYTDKTKKFMDLFFCIDRERTDFAIIRYDK